MWLRILYPYSGVSSLLIIHGTGIKDESGKKDLRKKAEEYLNRAEQIKEMIKSQDGEGNKTIQHTLCSCLLPPSLF